MGQHRNACQPILKRQIVLVAIGCSQKAIDLDWVFAGPLLGGSITPNDKAPQCCKSRQRDAQNDDEQCDLQPDQTTDLSKDEFNTRAPGRRNSVAKAFDAVLNEALRCR